MNANTQRGDLRDKVAVTDPAAAPLGTDTEAAGQAIPKEAAAADRAQAAMAQRAVPKLDASRAVSTYEHPGKRTFGSTGLLASAAVAVLALVGAALYFTLPG